MHLFGKAHPRTKRIICTDISDSVFDKCRCGKLEMVLVLTVPVTTVKKDVHWGIRSGREKVKTFQGIFAIRNVPDAFKF